MEDRIKMIFKNLSSVACENATGAKRASWRIISSTEQKEESKGGEGKLKMIREYYRIKNCCRICKMEISET
ncbi:hypothetical protein FD754_020735 [Muntiacus muntjak]|uniref:14-3-3 domain-containing protein n=1 Tax=Muntiacus muntjak TaxID=9888 RepID=A0A5N3V466_MUNMU|nr:hypothetical protein FD754_020735 [Muntiacus muntjak]